MDDSIGESDTQDVKRDAILKLARKAFVTEGYAATRMEPIAREAGISTATLYALFNGKAELYSAVIDEAGEDFCRRMAHVRASEGDARHSLTSFAEAYADFMGDVFVRSIFRLVVAERPRFQTVASRLFSKGQEAIGATLIATLQRLATTGELKPLEHPSWAAGQLVGMIEHPLFFVSLVTGDEIRIRRTRKQIVDDAVETFLARYGA
jgi:AcrR family transcriptional regulator